MTEINTKIFGHVYVYKYCCRFIWESCNLARPAGAHPTTLSAGHAEPQYIVVEPDQRFLTELASTAALCEVCILRHNLHEHIAHIHLTLMQLFL